MIELATGAQITDLFRRVRARGHLYSDLVLCSPFIGDDVLSGLRVTAHSTSLRIITSVQTFDRFKGAMKAGEWRGINVLCRPNLHAKFYLALGRDDEVTEAIITSANLTTAGLSTNIELGVRVRPTTTEGRVLLRHMKRFARQLVIDRSMQWKRH